MRDRTLAALSGVVTLVAALAHAVPAIVLARVLPDFPDWLPVVGTTGQTVTVYSQVTDAVGPLVTLGLALGLGYYAGRRFDVRREYRRFVGAVGVGSGATLAVAGVVLLAYGSVAGTVDAFDVIFLLTSLLTAVATVTLPVVAGSLAGAALVTFETDRESPGRPTRASGEDAALSGERVVESDDVETRPAD